MKDLYGKDYRKLNLVYLALDLRAFRGKYRNIRIVALLMALNGVLPTLYLILQQSFLCFIPLSISAVSVYIYRATSLPPKGDSYILTEEHFICLWDEEKKHLILQQGKALPLERFSIQRLSLKHWVQSSKYVKVRIEDKRTSRGIDLYLTPSGWQRFKGHILNHLI